MDLARLRYVLQEECHLSTAQVVLVGVSGGPDSLCLMDVLHVLGYRLVVAHFDHCLRPSSAEDAEFVRQQAGSRHLPFTSTQRDIAVFAREARLSVEEAARKARYQFLFEQAASFEAQAVAVAHTADDQVETVLMHLLRGAGLGGLKGMVFHASGREWGSRLPLVRPLLATWREEVLTYCRERNLEPRMDESNQDTAFFRNRLRWELLPTLQSYNPRIKKVLWRAAQSLAGDYAVVEEALATARLACREQRRKHYVSFALVAFLALPVGQQRSLLRGAAAHLLPDLRDIDYEVIERGLAFARTPNARLQSNLVKGLYLFIEGDRLFTARWGAPILDDDWPWMDPAKPVLLPVPGEVTLDGGWQLSAELMTEFDRECLLAQSADRFRCWLDADKLELPLVVRTAREGERFQPLGMNGHSLRFSDYWVNKKLSRRARSTWPLVWSGERAAWAPGYQPGHAFRLTEATRRVVALHMQSSEEQARE